MKIVFSVIPNHLDLVTEELDKVCAVMDEEIARIRNAGNSLLADKAAAYAEKFKAFANENAAVCADLERLVKSFRQGSYSAKDSILSITGKLHIRKNLKLDTVLKVTFPDGSVIQEPSGADTFAMAIERLGAEKVASLSLWASGGPLITHDERRLPHRSGCIKAIAGDWFVNTSSPTDMKIRLLQEVAKSLEVGLEVEEAFLVSDIV